MNDKEKEDYINLHINMLGERSDILEDANYDVECTITNDVSKILKKHKDKSLEEILECVLKYLENIGEDV